MITDILTVAGKELREVFTFGDARGRSKYSLLVLVVVFGIVFPLQSGREWVDLAGQYHGLGMDAVPVGFWCRG
ncbi:MAG: hypothetical protein MZU97_07285 [Bacillus subtilis]|nr:hypothetical protein [Bacillus subtilis]